MQPVDFLAVNSIHGRILLIVYDIFCVQRLKIAISSLCSFHVFKHHGRLSVQGHPRLLILAPMESACTH